METTARSWHSQVRKCQGLIDEIVWKKRGVLRETPSTGDKDLTRQRNSLATLLLGGDAPSAVATLLFAVCHAVLRHAGEQYRCACRFSGNGVLH